VLPQTKHFR